MIPLYFYILIGSLFVPMLFSVFFIDFIKNWKNFMISTSLVALVFLVWDAVFTAKGVWGFEASYCLGIYILEMPLEEWLFFYIIPFCSLFTHFAFYYKFPEKKINKKTTVVITILLLLVSMVLLLSNSSRAYTFVNYSGVVLSLILGLLFNLELMQRFYISFLIVLVPFFIVNGVLTGIATELPVVWYDDTENLGIRLGTIPIEDIGYAFSMLFSNLFIYERLNKKE